MKINEIIVEAGPRVDPNTMKDRRARSQSFNQSRQQTQQTQQTQQPSSTSPQTATADEMGLDTKAITQAPDYRGDPLQLTRWRGHGLGGQYMQDVGTAISQNTANAVGSLAAHATASPYERAPFGTQIGARTNGPWTKTNKGWINARNVLATPAQAETLDRYWYVNTQKKIKQQIAV